MRPRRRASRGRCWGMFFAGIQRPVLRQSAGQRGLRVARWAPTEGRGREAEAAGRPGRGEALRPGDAGDGCEHHGRRRLNGERGGTRIGGECAAGLRSLDQTGSWAPGCKCISPGPVHEKQGRKNASRLQCLLSTHE